MPAVCDCGAGVKICVEASYPQLCVCATEKISETVHTLSKRRLLTRKHLFLWQTQIRLSKLHGNGGICARDQREHACTKGFEERVGQCSERLTERHRFRKVGCGNKSAELGRPLIYMRVATFRDGSRKAKESTGQR